MKTLIDSIKKRDALILKEFINKKKNRLTMEESKIYNFIIDSMKKKIDYESFVKSLATITEEVNSNTGIADYIIADDILLTILTYTAAGIDPNTVAVDVNNQFLLMGYTFGDDNIIKLENFISGNSENWKKEIDTFKMLKGMLNSESCSVEEAYKLTVQLLSE